MNIIKVISGIFKIGKEGSTDFGKVLDAQSECCAGVNCCLQVLIMKDQITKVKTVGYFKSGVWTVKTYAAFKADGA